MKTLLNCLGLSLCGCSLSVHPQGRFTLSDWHKESLPPSVEKISLAFSGNLDGRLAPHRERLPLRENGFSKYSDVGGKRALFAYLEVFKRRHGEGALLLAGGRLFGGGQKRKTKGDILRFYDEVGYDAIGLTGLELLNMIKHRRDYGALDTPLLASNIFDLRESKPFQGGPFLPWRIVQRRGMKIGILSVAALKNFSGKDKKKLKGLYFEDPVVSFLRIKRIFQRKGVDMTILVANLGEGCQGELPAKAFRQRDGFKREIHCPGPSGRLRDLIRRLPPNSVDLLISGDDGFAIGQIGGVPVVQFKGGGKYLGMIDLYYDTKLKRALPEMMRFHPPVKLCHNFFAGTQDCHIAAGIHSSKRRGFLKKLMGEVNYKFVPAKFLGQKILLSDKFKTFSSAL